MNIVINWLLKNADKFNISHNASTGWSDYEPINELIFKGVQLDLISVESDEDWNPKKAYDDMGKPMKSKNESDFQWKE